MKVFIINLARRADRKKLIVDQLTKLGIDQYEFITAVDGSDPANAELIDRRYSATKAVKLYRELTTNEVATAISHSIIYQRMLEDNISECVILEDDAVLCEDFKHFLEKNLNLSSDKEMMYLGCYGDDNNNPTNAVGDERNVIYPDFNGRVYKFQLDRDVCDEHDVYDLQSTDQNAFGFYAYYIKQSMAKKLLDHNMPIFMEFDQIPNFFPNLARPGILYPMVAYTQPNSDDSDLFVGRNEAQNSIDLSSGNHRLLANKRRPKT